MIVYRCENTIESIFTAIYNAYEDKRNHEDTYIDVTGEPFLFAEDVEVISDEVKTTKVIRTLRRQFGEADYRDLCYALATYQSNGADSVYHTIVWGLKTKPAPGHLLDHMTDEHVRNVMKLSKNVWREVHHLMGFVRFEELENNILFSKIGPKNNVLGFLMPHFADRFPMENFVIYDEIHGYFGIHPAGKDWFFVSGEAKEGLSADTVAENTDYLCRTREEEYYSDLFREFVRAITITERRNEKLQRNLLPLRFRDYMVEFNDTREPRSFPT